MAGANSLDLNIEEIYDLIVNRGMTYLQVSEHLKLTYHHERGFSERNIRKFCADNCIRKAGKTFVPNDVLEATVSSAVDQVSLAFKSIILHCWL